MVDQIRQAELRRAIEAFYFAYREFTSQPDQILASLGLSRAHHRILYFIGRNPDIVIGKLLGILKISKQALNAPLRQLISMDLVASCPARHDRRAKCLKLSSDGKDLETRLTDVQMQMMMKSFARCPEGADNDWMLVMQAVMENETAVN